MYKAIHENRYGVHSPMKDHSKNTVL